MNLEILLNRIGSYLHRNTQAMDRRRPALRASGPPSRIGVRAPSNGVRVVARASAIPFWKMRGYHLVPSGLPGVQTWRGPLITRYGQVIAEIESAHHGQYTIYITNLPAHLHGHPCLPKTGRRWQMHVHGVFQGLDHVIFAAERELELHWNWSG